MSNGRAYQLLQAARVIHQLTIVSSPQVTSQVPESEAIARELAPLLVNPQALDEAWDEAVEQAEGVPTAAAVREVVSRKLATLPLPEKKPLHDLKGIDPDFFKLATRAIGLASTFSAFVETVQPQDVWQGLKDYEKSAFFANLRVIGDWIDSVEQIKETVPMA
jgi:hypothetical protein